MRTCGGEYSIAALLALARRGRHPAATARAVRLVPQPARHSVLPVQLVSARHVIAGWISLFLSRSCCYAPLPA